MIRIIHELYEIQTLGWVVELEYYIGIETASSSILDYSNAHEHFLRNYNIREQFKALAVKNVDVLDSNNTFNYYLIEAQLFLNDNSLRAMDGSCYEFCWDPDKNPKRDYDPSRNIEVVLKDIILSNNNNVVAKFDSNLVKDLPILPEEYFVTGTIDLLNWIESPFYNAMKEAIIFLNSLPEWIYPYEITNNTKHIYKWAELNNLQEFYPLDKAAKARLNEYQFIMEGEGFIINSEGKFVGKWALCKDLQKYYKMELLTKCIINNSK